MINHFDSPQAAALYKNGRPFYHQGVLEEVAAFLDWTEPISSALDAGCGTGLSTRALLPFVKRIVGVDVSPAMLAEGFRDERITYCCAPAEQLPVDNATMELVTLCEAYHWLDQARFLSEVRRVLRPRGIFLVYGGGIRGIMDEDDSFSEWFRSVHLPRYPMPSRNAPFSVEKGVPEGFELLYTGRHEIAVPMTAAQLAAFFLTVSNTLQFLKEEGETPEEHHRFLVKELKPFYPRQRAGEIAGIRHIRYGGLYYLMRKR